MILNDNFQDILKKYTLYDIVKVIKKQNYLGEYFNFKYDKSTYKFILGIVNE